MDLKFFFLTQFQRRRIRLMLVALWIRQSGVSHLLFSLVDLSFKLGSVCLEKRNKSFEISQWMGQREIPKYVRRSRHLVQINQIKPADVDSILERKKKDFKQSRRLGYQYPVPKLFHVFFSFWKEIAWKKFNDVNHRLYCLLIPHSFTWQTLKC